MLCCHCKKNQATKSREGMNDGGEKRTSYYCPECFGKLFISLDFSTSAKGENSACPFCGTTVEEFSHTGLVGCARCYATLAPTVLPVVVRMQGGETHRGKRSKTTDERADMIKRRDFLKNRVEELLKAKRFGIVTGYVEELKELNKKLYEEESE
jgi:protein-arginine kinase activator protein McsA